MKKRWEIVLERMEENFLRGQLQVGEKLPAERELAELFGVSRNSVREALQRLSLKDVIEIRRGGGSILKEVFVDIHDLLAGKTVYTEEHLVFEMLEVRRALEVEAASLAAQRATAEDLKKISSALKEMDVSINEVEKGVLADVHFHMCIVEASGNSILIQLARTLMTQIEATIFATRKIRFLDENRYEETLAEHKEIYLAIASGNRAEAKALVEAHITRVRNELSESILLG